MIVALWIAVIIGSAWIVIDTIVAAEMRHCERQNRIDRIGRGSQ